MRHKFIKHANKKGVGKVNKKGLFSIGKEMTLLGLGEEKGEKGNTTGS